MPSITPTPVVPLDGQILTNFSDVMPGPEGVKKPPSDDSAKNVTQNTLMEDKVTLLSQVPEAPEPSTYTAVNVDEKTNVLTENETGSDVQTGIPFSYQGISIIAEKNTNYLFDISKSGDTSSIRSNSDTVYSNLSYVGESDVIAAGPDIANEMPGIDGWTGDAVQVTNFSRSFEKNADIKITTAEGDIVTFSSRAMFDVGYVAYKDFSDEAQKNGLPENGIWSMDTDRNISFSVEGNLSLSEIRDIREAIRLINKAVYQYALGDVENARNKTTKVESLENIKNLSANLAYYKTTSYDRIDVKAIAAADASALKDERLSEASLSVTATQDEVESTIDLETPGDKSAAESGSAEGVAVQETEAKNQTVPEEIPLTVAAESPVVEEMIPLSESAEGETEESVAHIIEANDITVPSVNEAITPSIDVVDEETSAATLTDELMNIMENSGISLSKFRIPLDDYFRNLFALIEKDPDSSGVLDGAKQLQHELMLRMNQIKPTETIA